MSTHQTDSAARRAIDASIIHFSVDDVFDTIIDSSDRKLSLFDHPSLQVIKKIVQNFGAEVDLYVFYRSVMAGRARSLLEAADFTKDCAALDAKVHFAPHALDYYHYPFEQTPEEQIASFDKIYAQIKRFAGERMLSTEVRLHYYSESYELAEYFASHHVRTLFTTDRPNGSHRMPASIGAGLLATGTATYNGQRFERTQYRLEFLVENGITDEEIRKMCMDSIEKYGRLVIYTHECELARPEICSLLVSIYSICDQIINGERD